MEIETPDLPKTGFRSAMASMLLTLWRCSIPVWGQDILGVCGVPVSLFTDADGTAARESWRRFVMGSVEAVARLVEAELSAKLETPVKLSFEGLWAHDLTGRAQAFKGLIAGGMSLERAVNVSGLASMEE